ncbi:MAG: T9SS type A sorting domain-containing protein [Bacteroidia bacterium]
MYNLYSSERRIDDFVLTAGNKLFLASNQPYMVLKSSDGGLSFDTSLNLEQAVPRPYLRSMVAFNDDVVFLGTLTPGHTLYRTTNGGSSWENLSAWLPPQVTAICGMIQVDGVLFATGRYTGNAYFLKSFDQGETWQFHDLSQQASNLIDVHFFDANHGYLLGRAAQADSGAVLLETHNGGTSWQIKWYSGQPGDRAWKFFARNSQHFIVSLENALPMAPRYRSSFDGGNSWQTDTISGHVLDMLQSVAFISADTGIAGGHFSGYLFTVDGGQSWNRLTQYRGFNRARMYDNQMLLSGREMVYFGPMQSLSATEQIAAPPKALHSIEKIYPVPFSGSELFVELSIGHPTNISFSLTDYTGRQLAEWPASFIYESGKSRISLPMPALPAGHYLLQLFTDSEHHVRKLVKHKE